MTYRTAKIRPLEQSSVHACIVMKPCGGYVQGKCKFGRATPKRTIGHSAFHCALIRATELTPAKTTTLTEQHQQQIVIRAYCVVHLGSLCRSL